MGKNHRHQKKQKLEKAKTKLRVKGEKTKFLPKGLNETKTDFKIRAIVLPEQLRRHEQGELLSRRKLNVNDILSRLRHHNSTVVNDCCEEFRQLFQHHHVEIVENHLSRILNGVAPLILNKDKKVRRGGIGILDEILAKTPINIVKAFFNVLSSYLRCSMTNIDKSVQEDSLLFLDSLLRHVPSLVAENAEKILTNMFSLISKLRSDSQLGRTLTVNLGGKMTSVRWRIQVLCRLHAFLSAMIENGRQKTVEGTTNGIVVCGDNLCQIPIIRPYANKILQININDLQQEQITEDVIMKNLKTLMALLYEIWMEVAPDKDHLKTESDSTLLPRETAAILTCILELLHLLLVYIHPDDSKMQSNLLDRYFTLDCRNFLKKVMLQFPFSQNAGTGSASALTKQINLNSDPRCVQENLLISRLFYLAGTRPYGKFNEEQKQRVLNYVNACLSTRNYITSTNVKYLLPVVKLILLENVLKDETKTNAVLEKFIGFSNHMSAENSSEIFDILCGISQLPHLNSNSCYQKWTSKLASLLCRKEISSKTLCMLLLITKQNNKLFINAVADNTDKILANFEDIAVTNCTEQDSKMEKLKILHLFYYVLKSNSAVLDALGRFQFVCGDTYKPIVDVMLSNV